MSSQDLLAERLTFDDILEAVQDSKRGRWFLEEFQNRIKKQDSGAILDAIEKLETRLESMSGVPGTNAELVRARSAIAAARQEIAKLNPANSGLSTEGQLFANLAALARKTLQQPTLPETTTAMAPGIVRALQLVDELDSNLNGTHAGPKPLADSFFKQDSELFDKTPIAAKPVLVSDQPTAAEITAKSKVEIEDETAGKGAKLIIKRAGIGASLENAPPLTDELAAEHVTIKAPDPVKPEPVAIVSAPSRQLSTETEDARLDNPRIVIIRRKPEEMADVPMMSHQTVESAA